MVNVSTQVGVCLVGQTQSSFAGRHLCCQACRYCVNAIFSTAAPLDVRFRLTLSNIFVNICLMESSPDALTSESRFFLEPASSAQRQYAALRAYFVEGLSSADVSAAFATPPARF